MREFRSECEKWTAVQQDDVTATDSHGNFVVYDKNSRAVWDRRSQEVVDGTTPHAPTEPLGPPLLPPTGAGFAEIRVTDERDGELLNRGYATLSQAWVSGDLVHLFCGHADGHPRFFSVHLRTGEFKRLGPLLPYISTGEGWYWDAQGRICLCHGTRLLRHNPFIHEETVLMAYGSADQRLWQAHSSDDGTVHSATVQQIVGEGNYPNLGTVVGRPGTHSYFPAQGELDESQVWRGGGGVLIKESFYRDRKRLDNRIINFGSGSDVWLRDEDGAVGHSDCGPDFVVGEDDQIGACVRVDLHRPFGPDNRNSLFKTWGMGHVSVRAGRCLHSDPTHLNLVALDGSGVTPLFEHGIVIPPGTPDWQKYNYQPNGNLSPCGRVAMWMSNKYGRWDAFIGDLT